MTKKHENSKNKNPRKTDRRRKQETNATENTRIVIIIIIATAIGGGRLGEAQNEIGIDQEARRAIMVMAAVTTESPIIGIRMLRTTAIRLRTTTIRITEEKVMMTVSVVITMIEDGEMIITVRIEEGFLGDEDQNLDRDGVRTRTKKTIIGIERKRKIAIEGSVASVVIEERGVDGRLVDRRMIGCQDDEVEGMSSIPRMMAGSCEKRVARNLDQVEDIATATLKVTGRHQASMDHPSTVATEEKTKTHIAENEAKVVEMSMREESAGGVPAAATKVNDHPEDAVYGTNITRATMTGTMTTTGQRSHAQVVGIMKMI